MWCEHVDINKNNTLKWIICTVIFMIKCTGSWNQNTNLWISKHAFTGMRWHTLVTQLGKPCPCPSKTSQSHCYFIFRRCVIQNMITGQLDLWFSWFPSVPPGKAPEVCYSHFFPDTFPFISHSYFNIHYYITYVT